MSDRYDKVVREVADEFVMTVAVYAEHIERPPAEVAREILSDALARLTENGTLGTSGDVA